MSNKNELISTETELNGLMKEPKKLVTKSQLKKALPTRQHKNDSKAKQHRRAAANYTQSNAYHWFRRIMGEMKQSTRVQKLIIEGKLDYALEKAQPKPAAKKAE